MLENGCSAAVTKRYQTKIVPSRNSDLRPAWTMISLTRQPSRGPRDHRCGRLPEGRFAPYRTVYPHTDQLYGRGVGGGCLDHVPKFRCNLSGPGCATYAKITGLAVAKRTRLRCSSSAKLMYIGTFSFPNAQWRTLNQQSRQQLFVVFSYLGKLNAYDAALTWFGVLWSKKWSSFRSAIITCGCFSSMPVAVKV